MKYRLKYGDGALDFEIPEKNVLHVVEVQETNSKAANRELLNSALQAPLAAPPLPEAVKDQHVVLLIEDSTRDVAFEDIAETLAGQLTPARFVQIIICTGTHDPYVPGNERILTTWRRYLLAKGINDFDIVIHDGHNGPFDDYGSTPTLHNRLLVNPLIRKADVFLVLSDMKNHYFAGYSNAIKNFLPGVCAVETTERNHALALDDRSTFGYHPWHPDPQRRVNPVARDMAEGYRMIVGKRPAYLLATIEKNHRIIWAAFGELKTVTVEGIRQVDRLMSREVEPAEFLIVSPGGYPNDESIYIAQRALELSRNAVKPGGKILFLAECRHGIGPREARKNFYDLLSRPLPEVFKLLEKKYVLYSHKAYKFARLIDRVSVIGMHTGLDRETVEKIHLKYVADPRAFVREELKKNPNITINIVNDGNKIALHARNG